MLCSELTIVTLEFSSNFLVPPAFAHRVLVCFISHVIIFLLRRTTSCIKKVFLKSLKNHPENTGDGVLC